MEWDNIPSSWCSGVKQRDKVNCFSLLYLKEINRTANKTLVIVMIQDLSTLTNPVRFVLFPSALQISVCLARTLPHETTVFLQSWCFFFWLGMKEYNLSTLCHGSNSCAWAFEVVHNILQFIFHLHMHGLKYCQTTEHVSRGLSVRRIKPQIPVGSSNHGCAGAPFSVPALVTTGTGSCSIPGWGGKAPWWSRWEGVLGAAAL